MNDLDSFLTLPFKWHQLVCQFSQLFNYLNVFAKVGNPPITTSTLKMVVHPSQEDLFW